MNLNTFGMWYRSRSRWGCMITDYGLYQMSNAKCIGNLSSVSLWGLAAITDKGVVQLVWIQSLFFSHHASFLNQSLSICIASELTVFSCRFRELLHYNTWILVVHLLRIHPWLQLQRAVLTWRYTLLH